MKNFNRTGVAAGVLCASLYIGYFGNSFYSNPPTAAADCAAWAGALGSIGAIVGAWLGIRAQLRSAERAALQQAADALKREHAEVLNLFNALAAEIDIYRVAIADIETKIDNELAPHINGYMCLVFPIMLPSFQIYSSVAGRIGLIADAGLRTKVVSLYADLQSFFTLLNLNSEYARKIPHDKLPSEHVAANLRSIYRILEPKVGALVRRTEEVKKSLDYAIASGIIS